LDQLTKSMHRERTVATIADVARKAGVSVSTTWHVLNGTPRVAPGSARPLQAAIEAFGDRLNIAARSQRGLRMPKDLSVVGFEMANHVEPRLRLVAQPSPEIGRRAAFLRRERLTPPPTSGRTINRDAVIVERETCCRPK
jgi:DNA-binding LacI/PurR family transcriptional regulator